MPYTLQSDGDAIEKSLFSPLIQPHFPSYEVFWQKFVTPLTRRPADIQFRTDTELATIGFGPEHVCIAQLHYTVLVQLGRCLSLCTQQDFAVGHRVLDMSCLCMRQEFSVNHLVWAMSCLVGAQDVAFELLERFATRGSGTYDPWLDKRPRDAARNVKGGKEAQDEWKHKQNRPLQEIRDYRNNLVHGRTPPGIVVGGAATVPKLGKQRQYFDWRLVTAAATPPVADFDSPASLFTNFFTTTVNYFENSWQAYLLPYV
jgi:hypothetical protein